MRNPVIGVMGAGDNATPQATAWAMELGKLIAAQGWVLLSGGRDTGVMEAVSQGAKQAGGLVVGIVPGGDDSAASTALDVAIITGMGSARNNINVLSSDVIIACGNAEAGTLSEIALAFKAGKPVILLTADAAARDFLTRTGGELAHAAADPAQAVALAKRLLDLG